MMHGKILSPANGRLAALLCKEPVALPNQRLCVKNTQINLAVSNFSLNFAV